MRKNYFMKSISIILMLLVMMFSCDPPADVGSNNSNQQTNENQGNQNGENNNPENPNPVKPNPEKLTLQDVVNNANAGEEIDLSKYKLTDYNATINKKLTIKNGNLDGAKLTVTSENVKLEKLADLSVTSSSRLTINDSKLSSLLIGGSGETSRSTTSDLETSLAMVSVTGCEIADIQLKGFNSQLNITDTVTKIDDIVTSTKSKVILEAGSYDGMKDPVVEDNGELTRIDMTKEKVLSILSIYSNPKKTEYEIGEEIDLTGLAVMGTYTASIEIFRSGGWKGEEIESVTKLENQNDYIVEVNENFDTAGVKIVTITSDIETDIKCYFHVYVKDSQNGEIQEPDITDVKVKDTGTVKTSYKIGEKLDLSCYQVVGFCNGFEINLSYTSEPANGTTLTNAGEVTIIFYYKGENIGTKSISVTEPRKIEFYKGIEENEEVLFTQEVADGDSLKLPLEPTREGYTFDGWYNGETKVEADDVVKGNLKLTAKWIAYTYTVKFDANGGNGKMESQDFTYDVEQALRVNTFTLPDYNFAGWVVSLDANTIYTNGGVVKNLINENKGTVTLYAMWTEKDEVSPVFFNFPSETAIDYGDSIILECGTEGAKIYYTIDDVTAEYSKAITITKDVTITAFATKDGMKDSDVSTASYPLKTYTVTFTSEHDKAPDNITKLKKGDVLATEQLPKLTATGYTFEGWYNGNTKVETEYTITCDLEFTAKWTINTYKIIYELYDGKNSVNNSANYNIETTITLENPTKTGYAFVGWYTSDDFSDNSKIIEITKGSVGDIRLFAQWCITADTVADAIGALSGEGPYDIAVTGEITDETISAIKGALIGNSDAKVNLDLSKTIGLTKIPEEAFAFCSSLTSVEIPDSVTSIGYCAFYSCTKLKNVTIPTDVTFIDEGAFFGCSSLISVTIPANVTSIGGFAFKNCSSLTNVTIPDNVVSIGDSTFYGCIELESVIIGTEVTSIGGQAFYNCSSLTKVTIPDNVTSIGEKAFFGCTKLESVIIGTEVTSIGDRAFYNCSSLTKVTIPDNVTSIGKYAFNGCEGLTNVIIPNSVTSIGEGAFSSSGLKSVTIPDDVVSIGENTFYGCIELESVIIGDGMTTIGGYVFYNCSSLTQVTIPDSVTSIGSNAFAGCSNLTTVNYKGTQDQWNGLAIESGNNRLKNAETKNYNYTE